MKRLFTCVLLGLALGACDRDDPMGPPTIDADVARAGSPALGVMAYNVFVGARLGDLLLVESLDEIPFKALEVFGAVQATDFPERAEAIVDQIEGERPHLIGMQEVSLFRIQSPGDFLIGNPTQATTPVLDYLEILESALTARGLGYTAAAMSTNLDIELPIFNPQTGGLDDIRYTEFTVVLVRDDVDWSNPMSDNFQAKLPIVVDGLLITEKPSGWASVDIEFKGLPYRFVNTHLEPADDGGVLIPALAPIQAGQIAELLNVVDGAPYPVIMAGDFNSNADGGTTPTYGNVLDAGFVDTWLIGRPRGLGYTANQPPDLLNPTSELFHRIDFIFYRDGFSESTGRFQGSVMAERVGEEQSDRTPSGLWPSDHAGVSARLSIAPGLGHAE
ncbi:MAG: hypothetical protein GWN32_01030 [Gemmatimonadetes bacterium]|nr:hypothetical protein [Gemmatimonadota bacterium]